MMIDRIAPTRRPAGAIKGYQQWRSLLFLHWPVPIDAMRQLVPKTLDLDLLGGKAYVGVVPFLMQGVRPSWIPGQLAARFLETNVRTYVVHGDRPGVYFFSLDASSRLAVWAAKTFWGLPYHHAKMQMNVDAGLVTYQVHRSSTGYQHRSMYRVGERLVRSEPGTPEFFFLERYLLYVERSDSLYVGQVHHAPYPARQAELVEVHDELVSAAGISGCNVPPEFVHYAEGVDVEIFGLQQASEGGEVVRREG